MMSSHNSSSCFISYVDLSSDNDDVPDQIVQPILNKGEVIIAEALNVLRMDTISESPENLLGSLFVTNFRLIFKQADSKPDDLTHEMVVRFVDEFDVCLSMIDFIYMMDDKKKRLLPRHNVKERISEMMILCKNMRRLIFNFSLSQIDQGKQVTNALLYHAYPIKHELLFAYDFQGPLLSGIDLSTILFRRGIDWERELNRIKCRNWRVTRINENFLISNKMPQFFVVPSTLLDFYLSEIVDNFSNKFLPVWCWGNKIGVALVRMAELVQTTGDRTPENIVLEHIRKSHNWRVQPTIMSLNDDHLSVKNIRQKFVKFRKLFAPKSRGEFWANDNNFFSLLDHSDWLKIVSLCVKKAVDVVYLLTNNITVVLQEKNGQDISCVISSLMQIIWDPYWRTINGFQSLIQKEWIAFGHPFSNRLGHTYSKEDEKSPIFLVFFDCVWQLMQQYPFAFEFTDTYLIFLWDYAHLTIFDTFLFDSEYDRYAAVEKEKLKLHSFWVWITEHPESSLFRNILYDLEKSSVKLEPNYQIFDLEIWMRNYCRWLPLLNENRSTIEEEIRHLFDEIECLKAANRSECSSQSLTTTY